MPNTPEIKNLIYKNRQLFWWVPEKDRGNLSVNSLVEAILNYGNEQNVRELFDLIGIRQVADIFYQQISGQRTNYFPQVINFFDLYFKKHAPGNPDQRAA